jgi:hypothetical protein
VNPTVYSRGELARKRAERDGFLPRVLAGPKIFLIGGERDLEPGSVTRPTGLANSFSSSSRPATLTQ